MSESEVSSVLFDLDNTLCVHPVSRAVAFEAAFRRVGVDPFFSLEDLWQKLKADEGSPSSTYRYYRCCEELAEEAGFDPDVGIAVASAFTVERRSADVEFAPSAERALDHLRERYSLGLVTNGGPDTQDAKLDALGIEDVFDVIVLAGFETPPKPDPEPFQRAMEALNVSPERTVYVGNSLQHDVAGAHAAGLPAVWVRGDQSDERTTLQPEYVVDSLTELAPPPWERE